MGDGLGIVGFERVFREESEVDDVVWEVVVGDGECPFLGGAVGLGVES